MVKTKVIYDELQGLKTIEEILNMFDIYTSNSTLGYARCLTLQQLAFKGDGVLVKSQAMDSPKPLIRQLGDRIHYLKNNTGATANFGVDEIEYIELSFPGFEKKRFESGLLRVSEYG